MNTTTTTTTVTVKGGAVLLHQDVGYFVMLPHSAKGHELRVIGTADCGPVVDFRGEAHIVYTTDLIS